jgi:guanylate kinase
MIALFGGPSGSGKNTIADSLGLPILTAATTRKKRPSDVNGDQFIFLDDEEFNQLIAQDAFAEFKEYVGNGSRYGTLKESIEPYIEQNEDAYSVIEVQGLLALREKYPKNIVSFFIYAPREVCRQRMIDRGDDPATIERRMSTYDVEVASAHEYGIVLVNDGQTPLEDLRMIVKEIIQRKQADVDNRETVTHT